MGKKVNVEKILKSNDFKKIENVYNLVDTPFKSQILAYLSQGFFDVCKTYDQQLSCINIFEKSGEHKYLVDIFEKILKSNDFKKIENAYNLFDTTFKSQILTYLSQEFFHVCKTYDQMLSCINIFEKSGETKYLIDVFNESLKQIKVLTDYLIIGWEEKSFYIKGLDENTTPAIIVGMVDCCECLANKLNDMGQTETSNSFKKELNQNLEKFDGILKRKRF